MLQAMVDIAADGGWLPTTLGVMRLVQLITQARMPDASPLTDLPHVDDAAAAALRAKGLGNLGQLARSSPEALRRALGGKLDEKRLNELRAVLRTLPTLSMRAEPLPTAAMKAGEEGELTVRLEATQPGSRRHAFAPKFPKPKLAGWWLVLGEGEELFALKRIHLERGKLTSVLAFAAPDEPGEYTYELRLVSDSYVGLDLEAHVKVVVE